MYKIFFELKQSLRPNSCDLWFHDTAANRWFRFYHISLQNGSTDFYYGLKCSETASLYGSIKQHLALRTLFCMLSKKNCFWPCKNKVFVCKSYRNQKLEQFYIAFTYILTWEHTNDKPEIVRKFNFIHHTLYIMFLGLFGDSVCTCSIVFSTVSCGKQFC